jgi:hypothetical protein
LCSICIYNESMYVYTTYATKRSKACLGVLGIS